jgi:hypothetical protein
MLCKFLVVATLCTMPGAVFCVSMQSGTDNTVLTVGASEYFTTKMNNMTAKLELTSQQESQLKPIAEEEVGYIEEIRANPVLSKRDKLRKLQEIVSNSDKHMKPFLSAEQWQKLQTIRRDQKSELTKYSEAR